jgi:choline dehydrogenase-like flavoprotein
MTGPVQQAVFTLGGLLVFANDVAGCSESHDYCVVGAGPAGIQLGHDLHMAGRDFVVFERGSRPATFFQKFPIHRQLNSINRRQVGRSALAPCPDVRPACCLLHRQGSGEGWQVWEARGA